jgi:hypothetical protein
VFNPTPDWGLKVISDAIKFLCGWEHCYVYFILLYT